MISLLFVLFAAFAAGLDFDVSSKGENTMTQARTDEQKIMLDDAERQRCEVWTRVMGYHRPVASFNIGKQGEHYERRFFEEARAGASCGGKAAA
jgi:anaerobic ribonucleoside-triphosphate reductase